LLFCTLMFCTSLCCKFLFCTLMFCTLMFCTLMFCTSLRCKFLFCKSLCWYCGCHTSVVHDYERVGAFAATLLKEIDLWADAMGLHAGAAHLHFGGGSPNALSPADFLAVVHRLGQRFALRAGAEVAVELDPGMLSDAFIDAVGEAGVTRASLGVQTFDPGVQSRVNRVQPFDQVAAASDRLRKVGVGAINFDLMYGLPGQTPENVAASTEAAMTLRPDRVAVFGYAHVPWMKKHQVMIRETELADGDGRWAQAEESVRDEYARQLRLKKPDDPSLSPTRARMGQIFAERAWEKWVGATVDSERAQAHEPSPCSGWDFLDSTDRFAMA
jgi:coproporphyrinogen III oxidase-like Fe-S oxidoreductase